MASKLEEPSKDVSPEHAAAIGRVAMAWASFELVINLEIAMMTRANLDSSVCVTAQLVSIHSRITALAALLDMFGASAKIKKKFSKFAQATHAIAERRNRVVHDPWMLGANSGMHYRLQITAKNEFVFQHIPEDTKSVQAVEVDIRAHLNRYLSLWREAMSEKVVFDAWSEKYPPLDLQQLRETGIPEPGSAHDTPPLRPQSSPA